jgi:hypothetical protein
MARGLQGFGSTDGELRRDTKREAVKRDQEDPWDRSAFNVVDRKVQRVSNLGP